MSRNTSMEPATIALLRHCRHCSKPVKGRTDKKFCSDGCRNAYNNAMRMTLRKKQRLSKQDRTDYKYKYFELLQRYCVLNQYCRTLMRGASIH